MKQLVIAMFATLLSLSALTGCNTVGGFGQDVQKAGDKIEDAADR
jgi:entericidin A